MIKKNFVLGALLCAGVSLYALSASAEAIYKYDAKGNLIEEKTYPCGPGCGIVEYIKNDYDSEGNKILKTVYSSASNMESNTPDYKYEYTYDSNGNIESQLKYSRGSPQETITTQSRNIYTYDDNGIMLSDTYYYCSNNGICNDTPNSVTTYTYDYDDYGNIIKKYANGSLSASYQYADASAYANKRLGLCDAGFMKVDGACVEIKTRFTMQEAEALTTNDNNNWVEWTFE